MFLRPANDIMSSSAALCEAVMHMRGQMLADEIGRIARSLLGSPWGLFVPCDASADDDGSDLIPDTMQGLVQDIACNGRRFGRFAVWGRAIYDDGDRDHLASLAKLTANLLQLHSLAMRSTHAYAEIERQLSHQAQILDRINESVLTMDATGYITSWNKGAERLFGYTALEAVGRNILFLYVDEEAGFHDAFVEQGGKVMEVRRRKKNGDVFWASMSMSPLRDAAGHPAGLIAYLSDITERKRTEEKLHQLAYHDALTNLPNRTLMMKLLDQSMSVAQRNGSTGCVLYVDLNRFKDINNALGRRIGDELLREVGKRFRATLREQDVVARLSGDEFGVGLFDLRQHFEAGTVARKLQAALLDPFLIEGHDLRVGASIGISVYPQDGTDAESLLRHADIAMARAKQRSHGEDESVAFYCHDMNQGMQERMRLEHDLRHALVNNELLLHFQPKFEIGSNRIVGAEALVRWMHPERGMVSPGEFIPLAESTGLIVQVGEWVLEAACAQAARWKSAGVLPFRMAVNVSAREFVASLPSRVAATLARHGLEPYWLELEITESTLMHDIERVIDIMDQINALGVSLSLDDFGTGYSSLSYLKRFPIDTLKIDQSFTTGIPLDSSDCAIASTIISIGQQLGHRVIAEGVETPEQLKFLLGAGCDEVQGYYFSRPLAALAFEKALREDWPAAV
ncbi:EAL domain-containing protein [Massilia sp. PAMC28688]|uniref:putative bifunctional diguanylate cyclase/phosphodiesterase n=1 Tax=Massilia sp. PAMC28688 TaxID=2861283 RepID=UPI001C62CEBF|nr:EAL domain-containing protein [Massilia sp. PAMC28688]QYF93862.1 EAL domain-containing protein [Massilia sp. PAMC28688]